ncbi:hypothetical protein HNQ51_003196 [Inhella inkyongensis]|uniref:ER-bound oxygenase mpaB/mpaB'/Rubber oxygenase catalytic domain-containing protein n=1 Tax=Inhella inkyongensis TaxID=392593 RepID=A0A840S627_9BURK|nr:oxygenase MpaB family protein [Inhella inkyongensis]MBB5205865.1 hypothetical protein [Inhella inkyongensis]
MNPTLLDDAAHWDAMRLRADPLADACVAAILGEWDPDPDDADAEALGTLHASQWQRLKAFNEALTQWQRNADLSSWQGEGLPAEVVAPLRAYLDQAARLPGWADGEKLRRAEQIFFEQGPLSCLLLFCASLPECYVVPDLAEVLHSTGQLEKRTEHRIRSTAAMIFPVMQRGGLTDPQCSGLAQVLKVRLIHAVVRNLLLRGVPIDGGPEAARQGCAPIGAPGACTQMHQALYAHGWPVERAGQPCNQEELAYTLLTFGYVYVRGMRRLGLGLPAEDEVAMMHAWNIVAHAVGVRDELMTETYSEAERLFAFLQARGRARPVDVDPRADLGQTLMAAMATRIPWAGARQFPVLLTRRLCGTRSATDIGLGPDYAVRWVVRARFVLLSGLVLGLDHLVRLVAPRFTLSRFFSRLLGVQLVTQFLLDQSRPLRLPEPVQADLAQQVQQWAPKRALPAWLQGLGVSVLGRRGPRAEGA